MQTLILTSFLYRLLFTNKCFKITINKVACLQTIKVIDNNREFLYSNLKNSLYKI
jgi:hypothetical protein